MQLYPTRPAAHLAIASIAVSAVGVVTSQAAIVAWGGALLLAVAIARAVTLVSVARIRAAGFEMLWSQSRRMVRTVRGSQIEIEAEVRNRDTLAARYVKLRALASPNLDVRLDPPAGEVTATGRLKVKVTVRTPRVGQHGVYGLALEVRGSPGMFEVPLTFANPYGIEVAPRPMSAYLQTGRGGPSLLMAPSGRAGRNRGDGTSLRELREHQPGDPFRRIAWKATARRGKLLVREFEREERDVVWIILDVSVELWSGPLGRAPLDLFIDEAAAYASRHLTRGDRVGLAVYATTQRLMLAPDGGSQQAHKIQHALLTAAATIDASRSDLDELDVAVRVIEHLRPLDDRGLADVRRGDLDKLAQRADAMRARAPFRVKSPEGRTQRDAALRRYLACFGIDSPPKSSSDRAAVSDSLIKTIAAISQGKPRPSLVHVLGSAPEATFMPQLSTVVGRLRRLGTVVSWALPLYEPGLTPPWVVRVPTDDEIEVGATEATALDPIAPHAADAVRVRALVAQKRSEQGLMRMGIRVGHVRPGFRVKAEREEAREEGAASEVAGAPPA
ncbi:MAG: DUF58 domain-containing protein [Polyangiaceae bacterium]|jgi:uncharacterized protein (DUF58 family)|nr:DUF58 domain-containing protein [Polyangiaceae bacterium]